MGQLNLFDKSEAATEEFGYVYAAIHQTAHSKDQFTSDEIWKQLEAKNVNQYAFEHNTVGSAFRHACRAGVIRKTGTFRPSTRPSAHGRNIHVWSSAVRGA